MNHSESIAAIAAAMAKFQANDLGAKKNANNPAFKNKYANLESIWDAIREALTENGLSVVQLPVAGDKGELRMRTMLMHTSGEWIASEIAMPLTKQDPQGYGSAITYARRYALAAMLGVTQEDDDGNHASRPAAPAVVVASSAAIDAISDEMKRVGWSAQKGRDWLMSAFGKQSRQELTAPEAAQMIAHLKTQPPADTRAPLGEAPVMPL